MIYKECSEKQTTAAVSLGVSRREDGIIGKNLPNVAGENYGPRKEYQIVDS